MRTFKEILENEYHVILDDKSRHDESIELAAQRYLMEELEALREKFTNVKEIPYEGWDKEDFLDVIDNRIEQLADSYKIN